MLVREDQFHAVYSAILTDVKSSGGSVLLIVAMDTDALCAARILTVSLLEID